MTSPFRMKKICFLLEDKSFCHLHDLQWSICILWQVFLPRKIISFGTPRFSGVMWKSKSYKQFISWQKNDAAADCVMVHVFFLDLAIQFFVFHLQARLKLLQWRGMRKLVWLKPTAMQAFARPSAKKLPWTLSTIRTLRSRTTLEPSNCKRPILTKKLTLR